MLEGSRTSLISSTTNSKTNTGRIKTTLFYRTPKKDSVRKWDKGSRRRSWQSYFPKLQQFHRENGHSNVTIEDNEDLFVWTSNLRKNYSSRKHLLSNEKQEALEGIDFSWSLDLDTVVVANDSEEKVGRKSQRGKRRTWNEYFPKLQEFHRRHSHCNVTAEDDSDLYKWMYSLRVNYRFQLAQDDDDEASDDQNSTVSPSGELSTSNGRRTHGLPVQKFQALQDLGFSWYLRGGPPGGNDATAPTVPAKRRHKVRLNWKEHFPRLQSFHKRNGHSNVTMQDDLDLFKWMQSTRRNYQHQVAALRLSNNSPSSPMEASLGRPTLSEAKLQALNDLDFPWYISESHHARRSRWAQHSREGHKDGTLKNSTETRSSGSSKYRTWQAFFPKLRNFYEQHGHCNVTMADDEELLKWTENLRTMYGSQIIEDKGASKKWERRRGRRLSDDKLKALRELKFEWSVGSRTRRRTREEMMAKVTAFRERHGHTNIEEQSDPELYQWTKNLAKMYGYQKLNELGILIGTPREEIWEKRYKQLCEFHEKYGHCRVHPKDNPRLCNFVQEQRRQYRLLLSGVWSTLTEERIEALERLSFTWGRSHDIRWKERVKELEAFRKIYGHTGVPQKYDENPELGRWVMNQRSLNRTLAPTRINRLNKLQFVWNARERQWREMFDRLKEYHEGHGNLAIDGTDISHTRLRQWLAEQRHYYRTGQTNRLSQDRIKALESISGFRWTEESRTRYPNKNDWSQLLGAIRQKGISSEGKAKEHWFDGVNPFQEEIKSVWTDDELLALWNEADEDEGDEDENDYFEDEESRLFLRA